MKKKLFILMATLTILFSIGCISASAETMYVDVRYDFQLLDAPSPWANETGMWINGWSPVNSIGWVNGYNQVVTDYGATGYIKSTKLSSQPHKLTDRERQEFIVRANKVLSKDFEGRWMYFDTEYYCLWVGGSGNVVVQPVGRFMTRTGYRVISFDGECEFTYDGRIIYAICRNSNNPMNDYVVLEDNRYAF